jgi:hypothetical protein
MYKRSIIVLMSYQYKLLDPIWKGSLKVACFNAVKIKGFMDVNVIHVSSVERVYMQCMCSSIDSLNSKIFSILNFIYNSVIFIGIDTE